ncbi:MAG: tRNA uridine-5-carboxymethylaminomethyl(34) synthesis GTPase MnmE [Bacteroidetes bacterium]|nr:tRNA uridine-5-carboxymethylaminomethyl(34) synthesis GTPase MnmE [Bacteroidota bacterium]
MYFDRDDTIVALATAHGTAAIAVIRLSGPEAFSITESVFHNKIGKAKKISHFPTHTIHFGTIGEGEIPLDECLVSIFKGPTSFTGQDVVEISCHGSVFIQQQLVQLLIRYGARLAKPGEFSLRAFLNGKFDLSQAEAIADLIESQSAASHQVALEQMRGGFSSKIKTLRENLLDFASLIELELDFSEEDVEFANRDDLKKLLYTIQRLILRLVDSFEVGNVIKNGIPVVIVGKPNAGKSTLLNVLLEEERAIVSEIPGTTRDTIEDEITIDGILFRFIDTAGLRDTTDAIESIGVSRAFEKVKQSAIVIYLFDVHELSAGELKLNIEELKKHITANGAQLVIVGNKIDKEDFNSIQKEFIDFEILFLSAKEKLYIDDLKVKLVSLFDNRTVNVTETIVTNARHVEALRNTNNAIQRTIEGLNNNVPADLIAQDIREALHYLGMITGEISSDDLLKNIFGRFCIGK